MDAKTIIEPWLNGDPCDGCEDCAKLCRKLQARIDSALASRDTEIERLREALRDIAELNIGGGAALAVYLARAALGEEK